MNPFRNVLRALRRSLERALESQKPRAPEPNIYGVTIGDLDPEVKASFQRAWKPREGYRSKMESTSRGRHWYPRNIGGRMMEQPKTGLLRIMPAKGYSIDAKGTIRREPQELVLPTVQACIGHDECDH